MRQLANMAATMHVTASIEDVNVKMEQPQAVMTPPASEEHNPRARSDSGLSDMDSSSEDIGDVEPAEYFEGGKIPVFRPTMKQFQNFKKFVDKIDKYGMKSGIVKVVPPPEWRNNLPALDDMVKTIKVKNPISQEFHGSQGTWTQANMEKQRSYSLPQWRALCEESNHQPPARRGERRRNQERVTRGAAAKQEKKAGISTQPGQKRGRGRPRKNPLGTAADDEKESSVAPSEGDAQIPPTPTPSTTKLAKTKHEAASDDEGTPNKARGRQPKSVTSRRKHNRGEQTDVIDEEAFQDFDYRIHNQEEWSIERCQELETSYWRSLTFNNPLYGADMPGSLFDDKTTSWNVAHLENLLDVIGQKIPGVNTAYLYLGMWKATFAWHLEDVDLYSINYIHFGAPKQWYSISQEDARRFEAAMKSIWPNDAKNCDQFLRHKTYLISPQLLQSQFNIKVNRLVHYEGEFVITYPYGYHSGYNLGYNCAESVNFATESWLDYGKVAKKCNCEADSVWVDVEDIERKLRGEQTPEYYETDMDDGDEEMEDGGPTDLPTPPGSVKGLAKSKRSHKRKRDPSEKDDFKAKVRRIRIKMSSTPKEPPCCLCPNDPPFEHVLPTDTRMKAHRRCAHYTPETRVDEIDGKEIVCDVALIDKARLDLKCNHCRSKRGSVFQCSQKKCTRAYHATCAGAAGVCVEAGQVPVFLEDGTEYTELGHDFRCRFHRSKRPKFADKEACMLAFEEDAVLKKNARSLKKGDAVQCQYWQGEIFAGFVLENRKGEDTVLVDAWPARQQIEVEYKWILATDPEQSLLPKPSEHAQPLPRHIALASKTTAENPTSEIPRIEEPFTEGSAYKWAEFASVPDHKPLVALKTVDLSKPKMLWYYLGATSTEAKAQYTGNAEARKHDPTSNFLDTVRPPAPPARFTPSRISCAASYPTGINTNAHNAARVNHHVHQQQLKSASNQSRYYIGKYALNDSLAGGRVDPQALKNQQAFLQSAASGHSSSAHAHPPHLQKALTMTGQVNTTSRPPPLSDVHRRSSQPTVSFDTSQKWMPPDFQQLRPPQPPPRSAAPIAPMMGSRSPPRLQTSQGPQAPQVSKARPSSSRVLVKSPQPSMTSQTPPLTYQPSMPLLTPPSSSGHSDGTDSRARSDSLKLLAKWPYIHEGAMRRPAVFQSPYAVAGGFTDAAFLSDTLSLQATTPHNRSRSTSLMQDFLHKASPSQREAVRGHARHVSTDKAVAHAREAERRLSESRQKMANGIERMSPIEMMPEGVLGGTFDFSQRPGSSSIMSDRASPFPDFLLSSGSGTTATKSAAALHQHPSASPYPAANQLSDPLTNTATLSPLSSITSHPAEPAPNLPPKLTTKMPSLGDLAYPLPQNTLNKYQPPVLFSDDHVWKSDISREAAYNPLGTRPRAYRNYMRGLELAAGLPPNAVSDFPGALPGVSLSGSINVNGNIIMSGNIDIIAGVAPMSELSSVEPAMGMGVGAQRGTNGLEARGPGMSACATTTAGVSSRMSQVDPSLKHRGHAGSGSGFEQMLHGVVKERAAATHGAGGGGHHHIAGGRSRSGGSKALHGMDGMDEVDSPLREGFGAGQEMLPVMVMDGDGDGEGQRF